MPVSRVSCRYPGPRESVQIKLVVSLHTILLMVYRLYMQSQTDRQTELSTTVTFLSKIFLGLLITKMQIAIIYNWCLVLKLDFGVNEVQRVVSSLARAWKADLGPRRHAMAESIKLKEILHLMKLRVLLYSWPCFSEMRPASLLKAIVAEGPNLHLWTGPEE